MYRIGTLSVHAGLQYGLQKLPFEWYYYKYPCFNTLNLGKQVNFGNYCDDFNTINPDVLIVHTVPQALWVYEVYGTKYPTIFMFHGAGHCFGNCTREEREKIDALLQGNIMYHGLSVLEDRNVPLPNFLFKHIFDLNEWGISGGGENILSLDANLDLCVDILPIVREVANKYSIVFQNRGNIEIGANVSLISYKEYVNIPSFLATFGVYVSFLIHSVKHTTIMEAMASGLACIVPAHYEWKYSISNNFHALMYKDVAEIPELLNSLMIDKELRIFLGTNARELIKDAYNVDKAYVEWKYYLQRVIETYRRN